jgi:hypothetical protein
LYAAKHQGRDRYVALEHSIQKIDPVATTVLPLRAGESLREAAGS